MSLRALVGTIAIAVGLAPVLTGCGSGSGDADDVPTITTRPSTSASSTAPTDVTTASTETTEESSTSATETASPTETTVAPPTSAAPPDQPNGPTTYRDAIDRVNSIATQGETVSTTRFATPGDDVYCLLDDPVIGPACELGNGFITDADVCGAGSSDRVGRIETIDDHPRPVCNTDTIREPGAKVISPGAAVVSGDVSCGVEPFGVTCIDRVAGVGFFLGKGEYHVFFRRD
jgi:hypothetical protein